MPEFQNRYGTGSRLQPDNMAMSWGRKLVDSNNYGYNPKDDYFKTGLVEMNNVSMSTGSQKNQTYASVASVNSSGITPNNKYDRYNLDRKSTRLNSSHANISYAVFCLKKKNK